MHVINFKTGDLHEVQKYIKAGDGEESVWCNSWPGRHVINKDCALVKSYELKPKIAETSDALGSKSELCKACLGTGKHGKDGIIKICPLCNGTGKQNNTQTACIVCGSTTNVEYGVCDKCDMVENG